MSATDRSLTELIDRALAGREADPHVIAHRLLPRLSAEMHRELVLAGLVDRVRQEIRAARAGGTTAVPTRREGPSKWSVLRREWVAGIWKLLVDCDAADLLVVAGQYRDAAAQNLARAVEYEALAAELRASGCATVGELQAREDLAA